LSALVLLAAPARAAEEPAADDLGARTETVTLATSQDSWNNGPEKESAATGTLFLKRPCNEIGDLDVAAQEADGSSLGEGTAKVEPGEESSKTPSCPIDISYDLRRDAAPDGWLTVSGAVVGASAGQMTATVPYKVARTSQFDDYLQLLGSGAVVGCLGAVLARIAVSRSKEQKDANG